MIIKLIMAQRKEGYPGEHAPEALECMSEFDYEENPAWLDDKLEAYKKDKYLESVKIIDVTVSTPGIMNILRPESSVLSGLIREAGK